MNINNEELELIKIAVGEKFPLFQDSAERLKGQEYAVFEANEFDQGYMFICYLPNVSQNEKMIFRNGVINMRIMTSGDGMVIPMIKIGKGFMYEMIFDPTLYNDDRALQFVKSNNILTLFLIDSNTGELIAIRQCNFPLKMIQMCKESWSRAILDLDFSAKFKKWYDELQNKYDLKLMWERASYVGKMGETYDLHEIKTPYNKGGK